MPSKRKPNDPSDPSFKPLMRSLALELCIYTPLVMGYFILVLHFAKDTLVRLHQENPTIYAFISLILIVFQGILLEALTSWLLRRIGLR